MSTPNLGLALIASGVTGWASAADNNLTLIDDFAGEVAAALASGVSLVWKGPYAGGTSYVANDLVSYNGSTYIAIYGSSFSGELPTDATYWQLFSQAGANGLIWAGTWSSSTAYVIGNAVYYNGSSYVAIANSTASQPDINPTIWSPLAMGGTGPAGADGPPGAKGDPGGGVGAGVAGQFAVYTDSTDVAGDANLTETSLGGGLFLLSYNGAITLTGGVDGGPVFFATLGIVQILEALSVYDPSVFAAQGDNPQGAILATQFDGLTGDPGNAYFICAPGISGTKPGGFDWWITAPDGTMPGAPIMYLDSSGDLFVSGGIELMGAAPVADPSTFTFGSGSATTATAGSATLPPNPLGFWEGYRGTTPIKVPYYNA